MSRNIWNFDCRLRYAKERLRYFFMPSEGGVLSASRIRIPKVGKDLTFFWERNILSLCLKKSEEDKEFR